MIRWREQVMAPVAVAVIHQAGAAIDKSREVEPTEMLKQAKTYTTYLPAVGLIGWSMISPRMPVFLNDMVSPAMAIALDDIGARVVDWVLKKEVAPTTSAAVKEAQRIVARRNAELMARTAGRNPTSGKWPTATGQEVPLVWDEELLS